MGTVSVSLPSDGTTGQVAQYNTPITTIVNEINGNLDNNNIKTGAAISTSKLATDAGIVKGMLGTDSSWAWQTYASPTFTNMSGGTLNYYKYTQIGKTVFYKWKYTLGGAGVSGRIIFTVPVTMETLTTGESMEGLATFEDASPADKKIGIIEWVSTTTLRLSASTSDGTYTGVSVATGTSSTVPFTFASGDIIIAKGSFEAA